MVAAEFGPEPEAGDGAPALVAAADLGNEIGAVVVRGGRVDLAGGALRRVKSPTLLIVGEHARAARFVLDPATGQPVLPVLADVFTAGEVALLAPDESTDSLQLLASPIEIDPARHEACDRHQIYFGRPEFARWALLEIESIRRLDDVLDGEIPRYAEALDRLGQ